MKMDRIKQLKEFYYKALMEDVIPFWENSDLIDKEYGGFITSVDRCGKSYNDDKSVWFQGRCLWSFSKLCNTYGELCDPQIQRERFLEFAETRKRNGLAEYPVPDAFLDAFDEGMPESAGSAMGFDRLVMLLAGMDEIGDVSYPLDS